MAENLMRGKLKQDARQFFSKNKEIACPVFPDEKIHFNAKGINHLFYKGSRSAREDKEVVVRQIGRGQKHFWSVIPGWRSSRFGPKNSKKSLAKEAS